nr:aspartate aminotransferase family protein [Bacteroidota bacterium]
KTAYLHQGMSEVLHLNNVPHTINRLGSMISVHFSETPVIDFDSAANAAQGEAFKTFFHGMLKEGVYIAPSAYETWFICSALSQDDLDKTIEACDRASKTLG